MAGRAGRTGVRREVLAVGLGSLALAVAMTWPAALHPASTVPEDLADPLLQVWMTAWGGHALRTQPLHVFDANAFWPLKDSLAFSDSLLGYSPLGLVGSGPSAALVRYNLIYILTFALALTGAYALARQLGTSPLAAAVAGAAFAYAPWRIAHAGHLHVLSAGGIPLALALLARGHGYARAGPRPWRGQRNAAYAAAGWTVAAWQLTIGFGLGLAFGYLIGLGVIIAAVGWWRAGRPALGRRLAVADAVGLAGFVLVGAVMARPYLAVVHDHPEARRDAATVAMFSPPLRGFVTTPAQDALWGAAQRDIRARLSFPPEMTLAPGAAVTVLALVGTLAGRWTRRRRLVLAGVVVVGVALGMGTRFPGGGRFTYLVLLHHAPGWAGLRTPGRLIVFVTLALCLLAAAGVDVLARRSTRLVPASALAVVLAEGVSHIPHPRVEPPPAALRDVTGPVFVLPSDPYNDDAAMFWSTAGFPALLNGSSGFTPASLDELRRQTAGFPDPASVELLRRRGVRTVVVLRNRIRGTAWQAAADKPVVGLPLTRSERSGAVVFALVPTAAPR